VVSTTKSSPPQSDSGPDGQHEAIHRRFRALDVVSEFVSVVDEDFNIVFVNKPIRQLHGDLTGMKCYDSPLAEGDTCDRCPLTIGWDYAKGPYARKATDSHGRTFEVVVTRTIDDETGRNLYVSVERDITEKARTERSLATLMASMDQMSEAVCVADPEGRLVYANKAYAKLTGYDTKRDSDMSLTDPSSRGTSGPSIQTILKSASTKAWKGDMTGLRKDGTRYFTSVDARPVTDADGNTVAVVGILRDVTSQLSEKAQADKYASELEARMEARTTELSMMVSQLTTINKISRAIISILDLDELMNGFVKSIAQGFGYKHVIIMMMDKERGDLFLRAGYGPNMEAVPADTRHKLKDGIIGSAAYFGQTLISGDIESDSRYARKGLIGTKSELAVPVIFRGEVLGVLDIQSDKRDAFTKNDVTVLEMLADMLANSIANARAYSESKEREAALSVLDRISKQISYRLEPNVVLDQVSRDAAVLLKAEKSLIGLVDPSGAHLSWVAAYRMDREKLKMTNPSPKIGVTGRALRWLKTELVNDYLSDPDVVLVDAERFSIRSMVSAPLILEGRGIGVINVYNKLDGRPFTKSDALFLSSLADHVAIALENANLLSSLNQRVHSQLALLDTAVNMQRQLESRSVYELVADKLKEVVWYDGLTFYVIDRERSMVIPILARGPYGEEVLKDSFEVGSGITGYVARTGKAELVNDVTNDSRAVQVPGTPVEKEALMVIPLMGKEHMIGLLSLYRSGEATFSEAEFEIARLFASHAAVAVENAELYMTTEMLLSDSRKKVEQMAKVLELTSSVTYMDDVDRLLQRVTDSIVDKFGFKMAYVGLLDPERDAFVITALSGYPDWVKKGTTRPVSTIIEDMDDRYKITSSCYYRRYEDQDYDVSKFWYLAHPDLADKPRPGPDMWHERDLLMVMLKDRNGALIGYLLVDEPIDHKIPSKSQIEVLEILAGICSIAVENAKMYEKQVMAANEVALLNDLMSHDINNFTQGIMGYIELLLEDKRLDENQRRYAERALLQVKNNARVIDNVRKLTKIRMMADADLAPVDVHPILNEAISAVTKANPAKKITIVNTLLSGTHYVMANQYLFDVFYNILSNAIKFDSSSRVKVDVFASEEKSAGGDYWLISVSDRGRGIPDDRKKVVFERFATGVTGVKGFGLGLSIVKSVVDSYKGKIWVEDRVKGDFAKGTVFKIMLLKAEPTDESVRRKDSGVAEDSSPS
jgi:PAS domain S-box-containing protein